MRSSKHKNNSEFEKLISERGKEIEEFEEMHESEGVAKSSFEQASEKDALERRAREEGSGGAAGGSGSHGSTQGSTSGIPGKSVKPDRSENKAAVAAEALKKDEDLEKQKEMYRAIVDSNKGTGAGSDGAANAGVKSDAAGGASAGVKNAGVESDAAGGASAETSGAAGGASSTGGAAAGTVGNDAYKKSAKKIAKEEEKHRKKVLKETEKQARKKRSKKKTAMIIVISVLIILACAAAAAFLYFNSMTGKMDIVETNEADFDIDSQVAKDLKNYQNIAILGVDARKNESYKGSRSDAIIVARIKKDTGDIQLISVMRDSYLQIEGEDGSKSLDKITHAHAYGGGLDTCKSLNRNLDLNISEFVVFNWQSVADLVDAVGGVTVDIQANEISDMNQYGNESAKNVGGTYTEIYNTGKTKLNGAQAVTYCRIRKNSGGDTGRGNRYKEVMSQLLTKASKMSVSDLNKVANEIFPEIQTNIKKTTMLTMLTKINGYKFGKNYGWSKKYYGGIINGVWYSVPKTLESNVQWLHKKAFGQTDYSVTDRCKTISDQIINKTGVGGSSTDGTDNGYSTDSNTDSGYSTDGNTDSGYGQ